MRDERLLPFEYRGVAGEWQLELADDPRPFDYDTITDVVLHIRYTARDGGEPLRREASAHLLNGIAAGTAAGSTRLLSGRHEFASAWGRFANSPPGSGTADSPRASLTLDLRREHYPFVAGAGPSALMRVDLIALPAADTPQTLVVADQAIGDAQGGVNSVELKARPELSNLRVGTLGDGSPPAAGSPGWGALPPPVGPLTLYLENPSLKDLLVLLTWNR
jgi:hypothetical protein